MSGPRPHINKKRHSSSMSFYESHRRRPSNPHRTLTERLMSLSASAPKALKLSMGPRPNNSLRSIKQIAVWRLSSFSPRQILRTPRFCLRTKSLRSLCKISSSKSQKTPAGYAPRSPQGKNDRLRYRSAEWTVSTPWPERFQLRWHLRLSSEM